jgi:hypothetical protein
VAQKLLGNVLANQRLEVFEKAQDGEQLSECQILEHLWQRN